MESTRSNPLGSSTLRGIVDFGGAVVAAVDADLGRLPSTGAIACVGMDQAMVDLVPALVRLGRDVRVFVDRPRLVVPDRWLVPRSHAEIDLALSNASRALLRRCRRLPAPHLVRGVVDTLPDALERRAGRLHRERWIRDPWVRRQLTPRGAGPEPVLRSDDFFAVLGAPNCRLVTWPIAGASATGVRTCDGLEHGVAAIIVASGS